MAFRAYAGYVPAPAEMGQGVYHSIAADHRGRAGGKLNDVDIIFGQGDNKKYGSQITGAALPSGAPIRTY